jgi:hypothetical protein
MAPKAIPLSEFSRKCRPRRGGCFRHGYSDSRLESIYRKMKDRCGNPNAVNYHRYGGKGISVCAEWSDSPAKFYEWALQNGYQDGLQLDRKKNDLDYGPDNCQWRTQLEQQNNKTNNTRLEWSGQNLSLADWSRRTGIKRNTLSARHHAGWTVAEVLGYAERSRG